MQSLIQRAIEAESKKRLARYSRDQYYVHKYREKFTKRTGKKAKGTSKGVPAQWLFHRHFDPRYCLNHSKFLARGIWSKLLAGAYQPIRAYRVSIPKPSGGTREIDVFSVPDAAIAKIFLNNLRARNSTTFSDASYAYQEKKTPLDAILRLKPLIEAPTVFVSQYDFSKFFDSIDHAHLKRLLGKAGPFLTTIMERNLLLAVMRHEFVAVGGATQLREIGIPQGNSLSLFLANVAAHPLDTELSRLSGSFARFADDTVVINYSYEDALRSSDAFDRFSKSSGVALNAKKSIGIRLLSERAAEMAHINSFDFLGYCFRRDGLRVGDRAVQSIKRRCSQIMYKHLLLYPRRMHAYRRNRLGAGFRDWDLVTCLNEIRSYVYGGRSQLEIDDYLNDRLSLKHLTGAVSYFCLVEDGTIFRQLDGWLANCLHRIYIARVALLNSLSTKQHQGILPDQLINGSWYQFAKIPMETRVPSFFTAWRAARKSWLRHGLGGVDVRGAGYSYQ